MDGLGGSEVSSEWRDWSGLPGHLLSDISDKLIGMEDYVQFGWVCISWRSIFLQNTNNLGSPLLLIDPPNDQHYRQRRALYSPSTKSVCNFQIQLPHTKICRGTSFGWLITMEEKGKNIYHVQLQNLFLNLTITLPPLDNIVRLHPDKYGQLARYDYLRKAALSSDPAFSDDYIVVGIMSRYRGLAFLKPGNKRKRWTSIGKHWSLDMKNRFADVIFFRKARQFYALLIRGAVLAIEFRGHKKEPKFTQVAPWIGPRPGSGDDNVHLVEDLSSGDLLQVRKKEEFTEKDEHGKRQLLIRFFVYKLDPVKQDWSMIHDLGDKVLFIGRVTSALCSASDCPGCVPNCIYYTTDWWSASFDPEEFYKPMSDGIYNLEDGTTQLHYCSTTTDKPLPLTIWLEPTLRKQPPRSLDARHGKKIGA